MSLDQMIEQAIQLGRSVEDGDLDPAYALLEREIDRVSEEVDLMTLLPGGADASLGMAVRRRDGRGFYAIFKSRLRANLCSRDGQFSQLLQSNVQASVGAIVTALAVTLSLPAAALPLLVPLGVIICHSGLETFCEATEESI